MDAFYLWLLVGLATLGTFIWRFFGVVIGDRIRKIASGLYGSLQWGMPWFLV